MSYRYATVTESATDSHTTNNTWEDINSLVVTVDTTGLGTTKLLCLCTLQAQVVSASYEKMVFRFDLDTISQSETFKKAKNSNPFNSQQYIHTFHSVFEAVGEGNHTVKVQWHDAGSNSDCNIYTRRLTVIALPSNILTAIAAATNSHSSNNTWEDVNSMSVALTPPAQSDVLVLYTCTIQPTSTDWEHFGFRINRDADTELSEAFYKTKNANADMTAFFIFNMAVVFENVSAAAHTFKAQWHDDGSALNVNIYDRRITAIAIPCETGFASANDDHSANNTYENIDSMSVTLANPASILALQTVSSGGTSANNEQWRHRFLLDGITSGEYYTKYRTSVPLSSETYPHSIHTVFEALSYANHTVQGRWHDNVSSLDVRFTTRRIIGIILTDGTSPIVVIPSQII